MSYQVCIDSSLNANQRTDKIEIHVDAVHPGDRALVIDDLVATGGTLSAAIRLQVLFSFLGRAASSDASATPVMASRV
ncbi:putative adenine phosphoribosyltransferase [Carex littledalei]|uniref:adenine phosphoribosyltransferase n=1 Tax=Carex littledalei TaxID=544730 RepID=A0A833R2A0_9POAL|nr:putative adenine phosphoribosyltransferase [Carex littledalei]